MFQNDIYKNWLLQIIPVRIVLNNGVERSTSFFRPLAKTWRNLNNWIELLIQCRYLIGVMEFCWRGSDWKCWRWATYWWMALVKAKNWICICWIYYILDLVNQEGKTNLKVGEDEVLRFCERVCIRCGKLEKLILGGHRSCLSIHLLTNKMYKDISKMIWWLKEEKKM